MHYQQPSAHHALIINDRHDRETVINGVKFRMSYLWGVQQLVYTSMDMKHVGTIEITRPFASRTPSEMLMQAEVIHHMDTLAEQQLEQA